MAKESAPVHEALVQALGDEPALAGIQSGWLDSAEWASAIDRVRAAKFPEVPREEAFLQVGRLLGERFLATPMGSLARESARAMPREHVFGSLVPLLAERMRKSFEITWHPSPTGGTLRIAGRRVNPGEVTQGFFAVVAEQIAPAPRVSISRDDEEMLELTVLW